MKLFFSIIFFSIIFTGCASNYNDIGKNIKTAFLSEETLKVGVKKAYVTKTTDAKSDIIASVELNEELIVIGLVDNEYWFKVLSPNKEGYIPRTAMLEVTVLDSLGKTLSTLWGTVKNKNDKTKTTFDANVKDWSDNTEPRNLVKGFDKDKTEDNSIQKKPIYNEKKIDSYFADLSSNSSEESLNLFRKDGGLY